MKLPGNDAVSRIDTADQLRDRGWDEFTRDHPLGLICHTSDWQRFLESCFRHISGSCLVLAGAQGEIRAGLPLYEVRSPVIGRRLVSVPFASLSDPLVSSPEEFRTLAGKALEIASSQKAVYLEIRTHRAGSLARDERFMTSSCYLTHYVRLEGRPDKLMKCFDRTCVRQRISRAERSGLDLKRIGGEQDLRSFQRLNFLTRKRLGLPPQPYRILEAFWKTFSPSGRAEFLMAEKDGKALAGLMVFKFKDRVSAEISVSDTESQKYSPNHLLFWEAIRNACAQGYSVFDFGRTSADNELLINFKSRWGTRTAELPNCYYPPGLSASVTNRERSPAYRIIRAICRRCPDPILRRLGDFIYGHLG